METDRQRTGSAACDAKRWKAVQTRNATADGTFVYGVLTTGVYCRPTCPSRRPMRRNIVFFDGCADAERSGFRACHRCTPSGVSPGQHMTATVTRACRSLENGDALPSLKELARTAGLSPYHFHRVFKQTMGVTPRQYAAAHRLQRMRAELRRASSVTEAIYTAGFGSSSRFYERAPDTLGMRPKDFRNNGAGMAIRRAIVECPLGLVLVAGTERGICAVHFGDDFGVLERRLREEFPKARLAPPDAAFSEWVRAVVREIECSGPSADLPLDIRGTAFQQRVWLALREIPRGQTATYREIAVRIGQPKAVRAVASACAANSLAVVLPCHRVVRTDRKLSGYRWGTERKRRLLAGERLRTQHNRHEPIHHRHDCDHAEGVQHESVPDHFQ